MHAVAVPEISVDLVLGPGDYDKYNMLGCSKFAASVPTGFPSAAASVACC